MSERGRLDLLPTSQPDSEFAIWLIQMKESSRWTLPATSPAANRVLYCFGGSELRVSSTVVEDGVGVRLRPEVPTVINNLGGPAELLMLQGRPIGAPVFQMGPFVMNSAEEIQAAVRDYRRTQFGGWPWSRPDPVHDRTMGRFAVHADGRVEHRDSPLALATEALS